MNRIAVAVLLSICVTACFDKDTRNAPVWPRTVQPRLTATSSWRPCRTSLPPEHVVEQADCGPAINAPAQCDAIVTTHGQALALLASPRCTDSAIAALENFAHSDPDALIDLAAAYFVRAQRDDRPYDLLRALKAADDASEAAPQSAAARFNRALILESVGLSDDAIASWNEFLKIDHSPWATEGRAHRDALVHRVDAATQWERNKAQLGAALAGHDREAAGRLVAPFHASAERYLEEELLPAGDAEKTKLFGGELARITNDRFALDVVSAWSKTPKELREGYTAFAEGRHAEESFEPIKSAAAYEKAASLLQRSGSPLALLAHLGHIKEASFKPDAYARALTLLDPIQKKAQEHHYGHLLALIRSTRGFFLFRESLYVESLDEYDAALDEYRRLRDAEGIATTHIHRNGVLRTAGETEAAWREVMQAMRLAPSVVTLRERHNLFGEAASSALALNEPAAALLFQNAFIRVIEPQFAAAPSDVGLRTQLAVALRSRAVIYVHSEQYNLATLDLDGAKALGPTKMDADAARILRSRMSEVRGQQLLRFNHAAAAAAFTEALASAGTEFRTFRATLYSERADAYRRAQRNVEAERDLRSAVEELHAEEERILQHRKRGDAEEMWGAYFSRFQKTYEDLIRQLVEEGRLRDAFAYAERARAIEPLDLALRLEENVVGRDVTLQQIQAALPPGTYLIEYSLLEDQTIAWIISRDAFETRTLRARRSDVERWSAAVQTRDTVAFETALSAAYDRLIDGPLKLINGRARRLVFVPGGAMHGLPFAALHNAATERFVIESAPVEIAGSASLYLVSLRRDAALAPTKAPSALLIGDPDFNRQLPLAEGLKPLPRAQAEAESIYKLYQPHAQKRIGSDATTPQFLRLARDSAVVHVAAHTVVNAEAPSRSFILLAPSGKDSGVLYAQELLTNLKAHKTKLVVLSSCSSAGGRPIGAEGVAPLVRPLIAAGVPAVVGSLWNVDDATAEPLLVSFHRHYRNGDDAATALQRAQIDLLRKSKNAGLRSVLAWAPFQVIGHGSSPFAPAPQHKEKPP